MEVSQAGRDLIKKYSIFLPRSVHDPKRDLYKIGYQTFIYPNGLFVRKWQQIEEPEALSILNWYIDTEAIAVYRKLSHIDLNQAQFDAVVSFSLSLNSLQFINSELFKQVQKNKEDKFMRICFMMETNGDRRRQAWIRQRRQAEAIHYFQSAKPAKFGWTKGRTNIIIK